MLALALVATAAVAAVSVAASAPPLEVAMAHDGSVSVAIGGSPWLRSAGAWMLSSGGRLSTSADGSLVLKSVTPLSGSDKAGSYTGSVAKWEASDGTPLETSVRTYSHHAIFVQSFPAGVPNASIGQGQAQALCRDGFMGWCKRDGLVSGFPQFSLAGIERRGVVSFQGLMAGWATRVGTWDPKTGRTTPTPEMDPVGTCRVAIGTKGVHADTASSATAGYTAHTMETVRDGEIDFASHPNSYCNCDLSPVNGSCGQCVTSKTGSGTICGGGGGTGGSGWSFVDQWSKASDCAAHCRATPNCSCFDHRPGVSASLIGSGIKGSGPVVLFGTSGPSVVLSAGNNFMAASQNFDADNSTLTYGIMGAVTEIPAGYTLETILSVSPEGGVNVPMENWGSLLLAKHGKERYAYRRDLAVQRLGFSTDNGAFYYYHTEDNNTKTAEDTLVDVQKYSESVGIPYSYVLLDSWWYYKGNNAGVTVWDARPDVFPDGLAGFFRKTQWPTMLHNRMWATDSNYSKANGGQYTFINDGSDVLVPNDQKFWDDLIENKTKTGMFCYEQDWLNAEMDKSRTLGESATMGRTWMLQMNNGCERSNATIQLCMSHVRHILQSVEMPAATNARASGDYIHPGPGGGHQWDIGTTSILAHAVGLAPSKDNYWSNETEVGNGYGIWGYEPHSRLQSAVLSLSAGPVAPADRIGSSNVALIMRACDAGGRLLSPDKPATKSDASFIQQAFGKSDGKDTGADGQLWTTYATVNGSRYTYVLAPEMASSYEMSVAELGYNSTTKLAAVRAPLTNVDTTQEPIGRISRHSSGLDITPVSTSQPLEVRACTPLDFELVQLSPQLPGGWYLLGEVISKWVGVSAQRFTRVETTGLTRPSEELPIAMGAEATASVWMRGAPGEDVTVAWLPPAAHSKQGKEDTTVLQRTCKLGASGEAMMHVSRSKLGDGSPKGPWQIVCA